MTLHDDPIFTAYALGEADPAQTAEVERRLAADPDARVAVEEIRAAAIALSKGLATESVAALRPEARAAVLRRAAHGAPVLRPFWRRPLSRVGAVAAVALLAVGIAVATRSGAGGGVLEKRMAAGGSAPQSTMSSASAEDSDPQFESELRGGTITIKQTELSDQAGRRADAVRLQLEALRARGDLGKPRLADAPAVAGDRSQGAGLPGMGTADGSGTVPFRWGDEADSDGAAGGDLAGFSLPRVTATSPEGAPGEGYARLVETGFALARRSPLSTFSVDVDTASYANVRRFLETGSLPPAEAVRVEEMVNYFRYADAPPDGPHPLAVRVEAAACPWATDHRLVRIALKAREVERKARPPMNLVFLIDVSGSMDEPMKLPLVRQSMRMLLDELAERDSVSIVTYAGESGLRLAPTSCEKKAEIAAVVEGLVAGGSTNGASGIALAYDAAAKAFKPGGVNRVILCTDGDFNVGVTSHQDLLALIKEKAKSGTFLTVLGFGTGNLKDDRLEMLADNGNGAYGYVDGTREAHRILVEQAGGTLVTVAKDVRIQVEFNPAVVGFYRLVGYENRRLAAKDFKDDAKDAGDVGAGHQVTALYEVVPVGAPVASPASAPDVDPLKYQPVAPPREPAPAPAPTGVAAETLTVKVRYKQPEAVTSVPMEVALTDGGAPYGKASADFKFAAAVAAFAQILRASPHRGGVTFDAVLELASEGLAFDPDGRRHEFVDLVAKAKALSAGR